MRVVIFGSRTFAPLRDVRRAVAAMSADDVLIVAGVSGVANAARDAAASAGATCRDIPLSSDRAELVAEAAKPDTHVIAFAAKDPETKAVTEGTAGLIALLEREGVDVDVRSSPLTAVQALTYHRLEVELQKLNETPERRRGYRQKRVSQAAVELHRVQVALTSWLTANEHAGPDEAWIKNLRRYELVSDLLNEAKDALSGESIAA